MTIVARNFVVALVVFAAAVGLYGCASSSADDTAAIASQCEGAGAAACEASDNARQLRDADAYQNEPELGYVKSPPGMLPMPLTSRNSAPN